MEPVYLMSAARYGNLTKVRDLIENQNYPVDLCGDEGFTALLVAVKAKKIDVIEYLIQAGADVFLRNVKGHSPFSVARTDLKEDSVEADVFRALHGTELVLGECTICMESEASMYTLPCGDKACVSCLQNWFVSLLDTNDPLKCPGAECQEMDEEDAVFPDVVDARRLLSDHDFARYDQQLLTRLLATTRDFHQCSACPSGGFSVDRCKFLECLNCHNTWCRECRLPPHEELTCEEFEKHYNSEHEQSNRYMEQTCKKCPKCKSNIERNGGCSHMKCGLCKAEFCWWCSRKYRPGTYTFEENGNCPCDKALSVSSGWA